MKIKFCIHKKCNSHFTKKSERNKHLIKFHKKTKISCQFCPKTFPTQQDARSRYTTTHKIFFCIYHDSHKPECKYCDKVFASDSALKKHFTAMHDVTDDGNDDEKHYVSIKQVKKAFDNVTMSKKISNQVISGLLDNTPCVEQSQLTICDQKKVETLNQIAGNLEDQPFNRLVECVVFMREFFKRCFEHYFTRDEKQDILNLLTTLGHFVKNRNNFHHLVVQLFRNFFIIDRAGNFLNGPQKIVWWDLSYKKQFTSMSTQEFIDFYNLKHVNNDPNGTWFMGDWNEREANNVAIMRLSHNKSEQLKDCIVKCQNERLKRSNHINSHTTPFFQIFLKNTTLRMSFMDTKILKREQKQVLESILNPHNSNSEPLKPLLELYQAYIDGFNAKFKIEEISSPSYTKDINFYKTCVLKIITRVCKVVSKNFL